MYKEYGYRSIPKSSESMHRNFGGLETATLVKVTEAGIDLIEDVQVNPRIDNYLERNWSNYFNWEWMVANTLISAPKDSANPSILTVAEWGRAHPTGYGMIPYADSFIGGIVYGKGGGLSGMKWSKKNAQASISSVPWGFYGDKDAKYETESSNFFLDNGLRVSLVLGYVIFDQERLINFFCENGYGEETIINAMKVVKNGDKLAYMFRLGGVAERVFRHFDIYRDRVSLIRAFRLFRAEAQTFPEKFAENCMYTTYENAVRTINTIASAKRGTLAKSDDLIGFLCGILNRELTILKQNKFRKFWGIFPQEKDTDLALFKTDWEEAKHLKRDYYKSVGNQIDIAKRFYRKLVLSELVEDDEFGLSKIENMIRKRGR